MAQLSAEERAMRRKKKLLRRQKQREANLGRARKMRQLRLANPIKNAHPAKQKAIARFHIGCSGWFYWEWRNIFYPASMPTKAWFNHYAAHFKTVELNASFYAWPTAGTVQSWIRQAKNRPLTYTVKVCELITNIKRLRGTRELIKDFYYIGDLLGPLMGCFLFQLPPSYKFSSSRLKNILDQLDHNRRNVIEFRHKSWWNKEVFKSFRKTGTIFCSCSAPKLPDELIETAEDVYIRFHGKEKWYRHDYSSAELSEWKDRIKKSTAKRFWIYFNNSFDGHAIQDAKLLQRLLESS